MNSETQKPGYLLLFHSDDWYNHLSADELKKLMQQTKAWLEGLIAEGKAKQGQGLLRERATVTGKSGRVIIDGPFPESKEAIGGYMLLQVDSLEEAISIAKSNPTVPYGITIEVRPVSNECALDARARELEEQLATA